MRMKLSLPQIDPLMGGESGSWPQRHTNGRLQSCLFVSGKKAQPRRLVAAAMKSEGAAMPMVSPAEPYRELAHRGSDGLEIVLLWHQRTDRLTVAVSDQRTGAYFELRAAPDEALDVFQHPYAYAAARGVSYTETKTSLHSGVGRRQGERFAEQLER
jgi:hypothetical protein